MAPINSQAVAFLMLRAQQRLQSKSQEGLLDFSRSISLAVRHLVLVGQTAKKVHIKNMEPRSLTITGNKGLKSSINRNQSYAQTRETGL